MARATHGRRAITHGLLVICAALVLGHALGGHSHADPLAAVPVEHHVPGDSHHELTGGSCELLRAPVAVDAVPPASGANLHARLQPMRRAHRGTTSAATPAEGPPIFLLHAALLI